MIQNIGKGIFFKLSPIFLNDLILKLFTWLLNNEIICIVIEPRSVISHNKFILSGVAPEFSLSYYTHYSKLFSFKNVRLVCIVANF